MIFRREPIHKKLARQANLDSEPQPEAPGDPERGGIWGMSGMHGVQRPRRWDVVGSVEAPGLTVTVSRSPRIVGTSTLAPRAASGNVSGTSSTTSLPSRLK